MKLVGCHILWSSEYRQVGGGEEERHSAFLLNFQSKLQNKP